MSEEPFTQIETLQFEGMTFASVYDLVVWIKGFYSEDASDECKMLLSIMVNQLTRLVTK